HGFIYIFLCLSVRSYYPFIAFVSFVDHPHLPSFPTRRSSDLCISLSSRAGVATTPVAGLTTSSSPNCVSRKCCWASSRSRRSWRSEEHTSELQSLRHLVCRLLLEKKKKTINSVLVSTSTKY